MGTRYKLLVEGSDDVHVIRNLLARNKLALDIDVQGKDGVDNLRESFEAELAVPAEKTVGVVVDADTDLLARWQSYRDLLLKYGYQSVPLVPASEGTIVNSINNVRVGIWIMPNNQTTGILEDFIGFLIPENDRLWAYAKKCVNEISDATYAEPPFPLVRKSKAYIYTWLAWQNEPGKQMGQAITARYLDSEKHDAQRFIAWLNVLFG